MIATIAAIAEKKNSAIASIIWKPSINALKYIRVSVVYVVQTDVFNGFTLKTVLPILFNQMKNDSRNVVAEELNLDRIRASCPHAVTLRDDIEDIRFE